MYPIPCNKQIKYTKTRYGWFAFRNNNSGFGVDKQAAANTLKNKEHKKGL